MRNIRITSMIFCLVLLSQACKQNILTEQAKINVSLVPLDTLQWLTGSWRSESPYGTYTEHWQKSGDTGYLGESFMIRGGDTLFTEKIEIRYINDTITYIPAVSNQNQSLPVLFKSLRLSGDTIVFQNLHHDFPQRISYTRVQPDSLHAWIDGTDKGITHREDFRMVRLR